MFDFFKWSDLFSTNETYDIKMTNSWIPWTLTKQLKSDFMRFFFSY